MAEIASAYSDLSWALEKIDQVRALAERYRYKGEFGWGPWQTGDGPDFEGYVLDSVAQELLGILDD